jgi:hypothetical protein
VRTTGVPELDCLAAVLADPGDDLPRLVYADWLDETAGAVPCPIRDCRLLTIEDCPHCRGSGTVSDGRRERAEFIRKSIAAAGNENGWVLQPHVHHPRKELFRLAGLRDEQYTFRRGFVESVTCSWAAWGGRRCADCEGTGTLEGGPASLANPPCRYCSGTGRTRGLAAGLLWRAEVECPKCEGGGTNSTLVGRMGCSQCSPGPYTRGSGRVRNPDPPPPTAQPVTECRLTSVNLAGGDLTRILDMAAQNGWSPAEEPDPEWPEGQPLAEILGLAYGIAFKLPGD